MLNQILSSITSFIVHTISTLGYPGVVLLMTIQSAAIPLPSEVIMPFSGFIVASGRFNLFSVALAGAVGSIIGGSLTYWLGKYGGRPLVEKYGKYVLISSHDLDITDRFYARFGNLSVFAGRLLPIVNTFISIPAGIARVKYWKFLIYTFLGSFVWSLFLAFVGYKLGENWTTLRDKFRGLELAIVVLIVVGIVYWFYGHFKRRKK